MASHGRINQTELSAKENEQLRFENALFRSDMETLTSFTNLLDFWGKRLPNVSSYWVNVMVVLAIIVNEIISLATLESPMWSISQRENMEILNLNEYYSRFFPWYAKNVPRFVHEASRAYAILPIDASLLVRKLRNPVRWVNIFPSLVGDVSIESSHENVQMIDMEFMTLITPQIPTRKIKVLRYRNQIANDTWIIADISLYLSSYSEDLRPEFIRFPSGFIIQHVTNGFSKVTILEHWVYKEEAILNQLKPYLSSGLGFGAKRWLVALQRYYSNTSHIPMAMTNQQIPIINSAGRTNLVQVSKWLVHLFCTGTCGIIGKRWRRLGTGRLLADNIRIFKRESQDMRKHPYGILSVSGSAKVQAKPDMIFSLLYGEKKQDIWDYLRLSGNNLKEVIRITRDASTPRNDVSIFSFRLNSSKEVFLIQATHYEASSSMIIHSMLQKSSLVKILNGDGSFGISLPNGFIIMPGQNSGDEEGCVVSAAFQMNAPQPTVANTEIILNAAENILSGTLKNVESVLSTN